MTERKITDGKLRAIREMSEGRFKTVESFSLPLEGFLATYDLDESEIIGILNWLSALGPGAPFRLEFDRKQKSGTVPRMIIFGKI
jgi:hypothetical protein